MSPQAQAKFALAGATKQPDGQIASVLQNRVKPQMKNISLFQKREQGYIHSHPVPVRGAYHDRHERGAGSGGRGGADNERHGCVRRSRVVLTPRCWRQALKRLTLRRSDGGKRAVRRGDHVISRKATAQGKSDVLRWTCMLMRALSVHIAHETAGAARIRLSLRPLIERGRNDWQTSGEAGREMAKPCFSVIASQRVARKNGLLRSCSARGHD